MVNLTDNGRCVFRLYMPHAGSVALVGSYCGWSTEPESGVLEMTCDDDGWWTVRANLPEGDHEFCYLVDGRTWMPDYAAAGVRRHSSGRWVSLLSVPSPAAAETRPIGSLAEPRIGRGSTRETPRVLAHAG